MKVTSITNTNFKANPIRILEKENSNVPYLFNKIMSATSITSEFHSGQVIYKINNNSCIDIYNPIKKLKKFLKNLGIKFSEIAE